MSDPDKLKLIEELETYDHVFLEPEGVRHFTEPFGFIGKTKILKAEPNHPKGLTLRDGLTEAEGLPAESIAAQICDHLKLEYPSMMGRGFQLRACCAVLRRHFS